MSHTFLKKEQFKCTNDQCNNYVGTELCPNIVSFGGEEGGGRAFFSFFFFLVYVYSVYILKSMDSSLMDTRKTLVPFTDLVALVTVICDF